MSKKELLKYLIENNLGIPIEQIVLSLCLAILLSLFVYWVYKQHGITVPSYTDGYMSYRGTNKEISWSEAQPGDILIICKDEGDRPKYGCGHAGIYLGGDKYIHAPSSGKTVTIVDSGAKTKFKHVFRWSK